MPLQELYCLIILASHLGKFVLHGVFLRFTDNAAAVLAPQEGGNHDAHRWPNRTFFRELQIQLTTLENGKQEERDHRPWQREGKEEEGVAVWDGRERASRASEESARRRRTK